MDLSKRIETGTLLAYGLLLICAGGFMTFFPDVFMSMVSFLLLCFFGISFVLNDFPFRGETGWKVLYKLLQEFVFRIQDNFHRR